MAGADLYEVLGPMSDETARRLIVLLGLELRPAPRDTDNDQGADAA